MYHFVHAHIKFSVDKFSVCEMKNSKRVMSFNFWYFSVFHMNFLLLMNQFRNMNALWVNVCYWWNQIKQGLWQGSVHIQEHELIFLKFLQPMLNTITFPILIPVFFLPLALRSHSNSGLHLCKLECMLVCIKMKIHDIYICISSTSSKENLLLFFLPLWNFEPMDHGVFVCTNLN